MSKHALGPEPRRCAKRINTRLAMEMKNNPSDWGGGGAVMNIFRNGYYSAAPRVFRSHSADTEQRKKTLMKINSQELRVIAAASGGGSRTTVYAYYDVMIRTRYNNEETIKFNYASVRHILDTCK